MGDLLIPLALAALLIFFLFNSRRKQKARAEEIKSGLVPGATVMTTFGVFGTVLSIDEENNQVTIESGPGTVLRVHRQAIGQIENNQAAAPVDAPGAAAPATDADADAAADDEKPAITDAELDAMNERKRAETDTPDDDAAEDVTSDDSAAKTEDVDAEDAAETDVDSTDADADSTDSTDSTDSDTDKKN